MLKCKRFHTGTILKILGVQNQKFPKRNGSNSDSKKRCDKRNLSSRFDKTKEFRQTDGFVRAYHIVEILSDTFFAKIS